MWSVVLSGHQRATTKRVSRLTKEANHLFGKYIITNRVRRGGGESRMKSWRTTYDGSNDARDQATTPPSSTAEGVRVPKTFARMDGAGGDEGDEEVDEHCGMHRKGWPVGAAGDDHLGSGFLSN